MIFLGFETIKIRSKKAGQSFLIDPNLGTANLSLIILFPGRDMTYERALEIIQTEEYLTAADIDLIHKRADINLINKRKKRSMTSSSKDAKDKA